MSTLRTLERKVIKQKCYNETHTTDGFQEAWNKHREEKYKDSVIPRDTSKKKKHFADNSIVFTDRLARFKSMIEEAREVAKKTKQETSTEE